MLITKCDINPALMPTSQDYIASITENLQSTESYLNSFTFSNNETNIVTEGIIGSIWKTIKTIAKKILSAMIAIWKGIMSFCKMVFDKIKNFFRGSKDSVVKLDTPIRAKFISMESARVGDQEFDSKDEVQKELLKATDSIAREIRLRSELQIECVKRLTEHDENDIVTEAKRLKGLVAPRRFTGDTEYLNGSYNTAAFNGKDFFDTRATADLRLIPVKDFKRILNSDDLVEEYNMYCHNIVQAVGSYRIINSSIVALMKERIDDLQKSGLTIQEINDTVVGEYFYTPNNEKDEQVIRNLLQLKLNYNRKITSILEDMIRCNYASLGYAKEEAEKVIRGIHNDTLRQYALGDVYSKIKANRYEICKTPGICDFRKFGGGIFYYFQYDDVMLSKVDRLIEIYTLSLSYNFIISTHGGKNDTTENEDDKLRARNDFKSLRRNYQLEKITGIKGNNFIVSALKNEKINEEIQIVEQDIDSYRESIKQQETELAECNKILEQIKRDGIKTDELKRVKSRTKNRKINIELNLDTTRSILHKLERKRQHLVMLMRGHDKIETRKIIPKEVPCMSDKEIESDFFQARPEFQLDRDKINELRIEIRNLDINAEDFLDRSSELYEQIDELESKYEDALRDYRKKRRREFRQKHAEEIADAKAYNKKIDNTPRSFWSCYPIRIGEHPLTDDVNQAIRYCIEDGKKNGLNPVKIYVMACNGENMPVEDDIMKTPGVIVHAGTSIRYPEFSYIRDSVYYIDTKYMNLILEAKDSSKYLTIKKFFNEHYKVNSALLKQEWIDDHYNDPIVLYECPKMLAINNSDGTFGFLKENATVIETTIGQLYEKTIS